MQTNLTVAEKPQVIQSPLKVRVNYECWVRNTLTQQHSHMSFSLMMPQKYCGFSTKLDKPESSSEEGGLVPKFMKRSDTARSSSVPKTDEPDEKVRDANK